MIKFVNGDLLNADEDLILHQVNCQAVMGSGLALQIKNKFPKSYEDYIKFSNRIVVPQQRLGKLCLSMGNESNKIIGHIFGQVGFGMGLQTDYNAIRSGLQEAKKLCKRK